MSAIAIQLLDHLRESGVEDDRAVKIAEAFDRQVAEALAEAKAHSDRNRAESEEKAKVQFVSAADYHARDKTLATREDMAALRAEMSAHRVETRADNAALRAEISEVRAEVRGIHRMFLGGFVTLVVGITIVIAKLFFGV